MKHQNRKYLMPNSLSPDVFTGKKWDEYCMFWHRHGINEHSITCINSPERPLNSSVPTAAGVIATTETLSTKLLYGEFKAKHFLMEGCGGVGSNAIQFLTEEHQVPGKNITVIDSNMEACFNAQTKGANAVCVEANEYYQALSQNDIKFDIWINNGVGDTVGLTEVINLLSSGIKIFVGGANNLFKVSELEIVLDLIAKHGAFAFPDYACSGGGWTLAVLEQIRKIKGDLSVNALEVIKERNVKMALDALSDFKPGSDLWRTVAMQAEIKIAHALQQHSKLTEDDFVIDNWQL